ncbi:MAG: hypothetical protein QXG00_08445 [Candidatus Woesearchaeota archaeon]
MVQDLINTVNYIQIRAGKLDETKRLLISDVSKNIETIKNIKNQYQTCDLAKSFYQRAVDGIYNESVAELNMILNSAIRYIFYDKRFTVELQLNDRRGKALNIILRDEDMAEPIDINVKNGVGAGVRTVISFILHFYYLLNKDSKILLLDESYSYVSEEYRAKFFEFIQNIAVEREFIIGLIAHLDFISDYANCKYKIQDGVLIERR